jgi:hypothetical protein
MRAWFMDTKFLNRPEFLSVFDTEQDYVDAMFIMIVMYNFGQWLDSNALYTSAHDVGSWTAETNT